MPDALTIDIQTKVIPATVRIWALFPGLRRRYLGTFLEQNVIFLDLPGLNLLPPVLADRVLLKRHVAMAEAIARSYTRGGQAAPVSRNPLTYDPGQTQLVSTLSHVRRFFTEIQVGDLVAVAGDLYSPVYFGEVLRAFRPTDRLSIPRYGNEQIPFLAVRWHRSSKERRYFSAGLIKHLVNRKALTEINRLLFGNEVFSATYGDYIIDEEAQYIIEGDAYDNDGTKLLAPITLISYLIAAFDAIDEGQIEEFAGLGIHEASERYYDAALLNSLQVEFGSPGRFTIAAKKAALPLFVAVCLHSAIAGLPLDEARAAEVTNSVAPGDPCTIAINDKYKALMATLGEARWAQLCHEAEKAKNGVNLNSRVRPHHQEGAR